MAESTSSSAPTAQLWPLPVGVSTKSTPSHMPHRLQLQKEHMVSTGSPCVVAHHGAHCSVFPSATWPASHGAAISWQNEHSLHLHLAQCSLAYAGLQKLSHVGKETSSA